MHNRQFNPPSIICKTNFFRCRIRAVRAFQQSSLSKQYPTVERGGISSCNKSAHPWATVVLGYRLALLPSPRAHHLSSPLLPQSTKIPLASNRSRQGPKTELKKTVCEKSNRSFRKLANWEARVPVDNVGVGIGQLVGGGVHQQHHGGRHLSGSR